jgi:hypothetical protein
MGQLEARLARLASSARAAALGDLYAVLRQLWAGFTDEDMTEVAAMREDAKPEDPDLTPAQRLALRRFADLGPELDKLTRAAWPLLTDRERAAILMAGAWPTS